MTLILMKRLSPELFLKSTMLSVIQLCIRPKAQEETWSVSKDDIFINP